MLIVGKILAALFFPPGIFILLALLCALLVHKGRKKAASAIALASAILLYTLSTPLVSGLLALPLENKYPPLLFQSDAQAIVVLGGGFLELSPEYGAGALAADSEKRAVYGMELSRAYGLPLLYSGGAAYDSKLPGTAAEAAGRLWRSLGLAADRITLETASLDTRGNARGVAEVAGEGPFILVTTAMHMARSVLSFERAGVKVYPAPTDYRVKRTSLTFSDFLPDAYSLDTSRFALHEYVGFVYYRLT